jgi:dipeptidase
MKITFAIGLAAISVAATSMPAFAQNAQDAQEKRGHYEWRHVPQPGPNKSNLPNLRRVWVPDSDTVKAARDAKRKATPCCRPCDNNP